MTFEFHVPQSSAAREAIACFTELQSNFVTGLTRVDPSTLPEEFERVSWLRNQGDNGGGVRFQRANDAFLNRASLNFSTVHYEADSERALSSASALSCIVHPSFPLAPSLHTHISWTDLKSGKSGWRMMADLNPSNPIEDHRTLFLNSLKQVFQEQEDSVVEHGLSQGDQYFSIPALNRHRGVVHFYLEQWSSGDFDADLKLARQFGQEVIRCYLQILEDSLQRGNPTEQHQANQLHYHTLYFFQVLTLDRGTTSGILVHDQNDAGILGSLPGLIDRSLLETWLEKVPPLQQTLLQSILDTLPQQQRIELTLPLRIKLAQTLRQHYRDYPETQDLLARGFKVPPTVKNHQVTIDE